MIARLFTTGGHRLRQLAAGVLAVTCLVAISGCQAPLLRMISEQQLQERQRGYLNDYESELRRMSARSAERIEAEYRRATVSNDDQSQSHDILVLSGGGAFGAFGAGFLQGWGQVTDPEWARPHFDAVSGVSTGSLIAPFAFLGTPDAYRAIVQLYENPGRDWVRRQGIVAYLPGNVSVFDVTKLHDTIRTAITPKLMHAIAQGAAEGRQLLVAATNVDFGLMRIWDLADMALDSPVDVAIERSVDVLKASSAIPGAFPPILIDDFLYVDGGATMQVVGGQDDRGWAYLPHDQSLVDFVHRERPIKIRVWFIVNQKLLPTPEVVRPRWTSVAVRSLDTLLRTSTLQSIQDTETFVRLINQRDEFDAEMRYVAIPQDFPIPDTEQMFDAEAMRALATLGRRMGADPGSWRTRALRPGAPFWIE